MAKIPSLLSPSGQESLRFGEASSELLSDLLSNLNTFNRSSLSSLSRVCGQFKGGKVAEHTFLICEELGLDPIVGYHAIEILDRFMVKYIENFILSLRSETGNDSSCGAINLEHLIYQSLHEKFQIILLSSVQIASKLALHSKAVDNNSLARYLQSIGSSCPKEKLLETELLILKTLDFQPNVPNPLLYVETLLEVLAHNAPAMPVAQLHHLCRYVLQFIYLKRGPVYQSLLVAVTGCLNPSTEQREKFVSVTEDCMLLGVGVITVSAYIYQMSVWEKVVEELNLITGISARSIIDFAQVTLKHITKNSAP